MKKTTVHYIAYMDILGYKNYLKTNPEKTEQYLNTILDAVDRVKGNISSFKTVAAEKFQIKGELKLKVFSDNILLCLPVKRGNDEVRRAIAFLLSVALIQRGLVLQHGLIVRGGITTGKLFINDDIVFGQGLVDAVELEKSAEYPCVIVSPETQKYLFGLRHDVADSYQRIKEIVEKEYHQQQISEDEKTFLNENLGYVTKEVYYLNSFKQLIRQYDNENAFINYLFDFSISTILGYRFAEYVGKAATRDPEKYKGIVETHENYFDILLAHKDFLIKNIKDYCNYDGIDKNDQNAIQQREKIIKKCVWLLRYHISMCSECGFKMGLFVHKFSCDKDVLRLIVRVLN